MAFTINEIFAIADGSLTGFSAGDTVTGSTSGATAVLLSDAIAPTRSNFDRRYDQWDGDYDMKLPFTTAHALSGTTFIEGETVTSNGGGTATLAFISGSIDVTGVNNSLVGIASICDYITTETVGADFYGHDMGNFRLQADGAGIELNISPDDTYEKVTFKSNAMRNELYFDNGAILRLGSVRTNRTEVYLKNSTVIECRNGVSNGEVQSRPEHSSIRIDDEGVFEGYGVNICLGGNFYWEGGGLTQELTIDNYSGGSPRIDLDNRFTTLSKDINGLKYTGIAPIRGIILRTDSASRFTQLKNLFPINSSVPLLGNSNIGTTAFPFPLEDLPEISDFNGNIYGLFLNDSFKFINYPSMRIFFYGNIDRSNSTAGQGSAIGVKNVSWEVKDSVGSVLTTGLKARIVDINNGRRPTQAEVEYWAHNQWPDLWNDQQYQWGDGGTSFAAEQEVVTGIVWYNNSGTENPFIAGQYCRIDIRTEQGAEGWEDSDATLTACLMGQGYAFVIVPVDLLGNGTNKIAWTMFADPLETETDEAAILAYASQDNVFEAYDFGYAKFRENHYDEQELYFTRNNTYVLAGDKDILVDAATAFSQSTTNLVFQSPNWDGGFETSGDVVTGAGTTCEDIKILGANSFTPAIVPALATLEGMAQGLVINTAGTFDVSQHIRISNTFDYTVADGTGVVTLVTGGQSITVDEGVGNTVIIDDSTPWNFSFSPSGGTFAMLNIDKWNTFLGVYTSDALAQAANPAPVSGDYYAVDSNGDLTRETHGYWDGSAWQIEAINSLYEYGILSSDLGGAGAGATEQFGLPSNTNFRWFYDGLNVTPKTGEFNTGAANPNISVELVTNSSFNGISPAIYADVLTNYLPLATLLPADASGVITGFVPALPAGDIDYAIVFVEYMRLTLSSAEGALVTGDPYLLEVVDKAIVVKDDTFRVFPLDNYPSGTDVPFGAYVNLINYTIEFAPFDANFNKVCYGQTPYTIVNGSSVIGEVDSNVIDIQQAPLAKFATVNTDETTPVAGSVAQLSQGSGGGGTDVNVVSVAGNAVTGVDDFKADVSAIPTNTLLTDDVRLNNLDAAISTRSTFDPATDAVANVTTVQTTVTNSDMRGTDNALLAASYTVPDNAGISSANSKLDNLNDISVADIEASAVLAKEVTVNGVPAAVDSELSSNHGNGSWEGVAANEADIHNALDSYVNKDDYKADLSSVPSATQNASAVWNRDRSLEMTSGTYGATDEWTGSLDESALHSALDSYTNKGAWKNTANELAQGVWNANRASYSVNGTFGATSEWTGSLDESALHTALDSYTNKDSWKADVSLLATSSSILTLQGVVNDVYAAHYNRRTLGATQITLYEADETTIKTTFTVTKSLGEIVEIDPDV